MPLSEEELRLLEQMERALVAEDPKLASTMRGTKIRRHQRRQLAVGIAAFVVGVALLMSGAVLTKVYLGVIGFVVMLAAVTFSLSTWRTRGSAAEQDTEESAPSEAGLHVIDGGKPRRRRPPKQESSGTMMDRFEERWRRRREGGER